MPVINDNENPAASHSKLNLVQVLNTVAFLLKKITGEDSKEDSSKYFTC
jgi:hypothetical protein